MNTGKTLSLIPYPAEIDYLEGKSEIGNDTITEILYDELPMESYELSVIDNKVSAVVSDKAGEFYAKQTLRQLIASCNGTIDNMRIKDCPAFRYRGFMLDCARHSSSTEEIKRLLDAMAYLKFNVFHWHLTDDQGWRIESKRFPRLNEIGSVRCKSAFGGNIVDEEYSSFFTQKEIVDIVSYAAERFIEVIPEIDVPGHTSALIASYPELSCTGEKIEVQTKQGIFSDILCPGKESTFDFLFSLLDEVIPLFPSCYFHIGGDEVPRNRWKVCPDCQKTMKEKGYESEQQLQGFFTGRIAEFLKSKGKTPIVWNDTLKCGSFSRDDAIVQRWLDKSNQTDEFARSKGSYIESDFFHYYADYSYGQTPLKKTYNYVPGGRKNSTPPIGIEIPIWTEYISDFGKLSYMLFPRMCAVSESAWSGDNKSYKRFLSSLPLILNYLRSIGITPAEQKVWDMPVLVRIYDVCKFYKGKISVDILKNARENMKD